MYLGIFAPLSNKADWIQQFEIVDADTDEPIDLTTLTEITFDVREPKSKTVKLSATLGDKITLVDTGTFEVHFTEEDMRALCAETYEIGCTIKDADSTRQIIIGTVPVLDGVVS